MSSLEKCYYVILINNHHHNITIPSTLKVTNTSVLTTLTGNNGTVSHLHDNTYYLPHVLSMTSNHWMSKPYYVKFGATNALECFVHSGLNVSLKISSMIAFRIFLIEIRSLIDWERALYSASIVYNAI
jgi:hypothetical protein